VLTGGAPTTGSVARKVLQMVPGQQSRKEDFNLTSHEKKVLELLVKGFSYKMKAAEQQVTVDTVRFIRTAQLWHSILPKANKFLWKASQK
jgi:DNA-binding NarL/FixJ family response regulator